MLKYAAGSTKAWTAILAAIMLWLSGCGSSISEPASSEPVKPVLQAGKSSSISPISKPTVWSAVPEIPLSSGPIRSGDSEDSVRRKTPEPIEWEVPLDPEVRIELATETVRSIKKVDTFYMEGKWFRVSMRRKVPRRPYLIRWKGYDQPAKFVVYRVEAPKEGAPTAAVRQADKSAVEKPPNYSVASPLTRRLLDSGVPVATIAINGGSIRVGDLTDDSVKYAKATDRIAPPFVQGDPALPRSLIVVQTPRGTPENRPMRDTPKPANGTEAGQGLLYRTGDAVGNEYSRW